MPTTERPGAWLEEDLSHVLVFMPEPETTMMKERDDVQR